MDIAVFGKCMENRRKKIEISNLSQQKEEEAIWCQNQVIILQSLTQKIYYQLKWKKLIYTRESLSF